jgi:hypothetical protein
MEYEQKTHSKFNTANCETSILLACITGSNKAAVLLEGRLL